MFTRAYDATMCGRYVNGLYTGAFDTTALSDTSVLNCKDCNGYIRCVYSLPVERKMPMVHIASNAGGSAGGTILFPDTDSTTPTYEDYACPDWQPNTQPTSSIWKFIAVVNTEEYDSNANEFVRTAKVRWTNNSATERTVYGIKVLYYGKYALSATNFYDDTFLIAREHFETPVTVPAGEILELTLTYRVSRHGVRIDNANGGV